MVAGAVVAVAAAAAAAEARSQRHAAAVVARQGCGRGGRRGRRGGNYGLRLHVAHRESVAALIVPRRRAVRGCRCRAPTTRRCRSEETPVPLSSVPVDLGRSRREFSSVFRAVIVICNGAVCGTRAKKRACESSLSFPRGRGIFLSFLLSLSRDALP